MNFKYEAYTKDAYKDRKTAHEYHKAFTGPVTWKTYRAHFVARREQQIVQSFLDILKPRRVVDIPCGTGKLATVLVRYDCDVLAADISAEMLDVARLSYGAIRANLAVHFLNCDVLDIKSVAQTFAPDTVVCLRLMHRVPADVRARMLKAISATAKFAVISYGLKSRYHTVRKKIRNVVFNEPARPLCLAPIEDIEAELADGFVTLQVRHVSRILSEEVIFLLQSRASMGSQAV